MQIRILPRNGALTRDTRRAIERQVRLVVGRYAAAVDRLQLTLRPPGEGDANGSLRCRIHVELGHGETLTCVEEGPDPVAAASGAAWRVQRRLRQRAGPSPGRAEEGAGDSARPATRAPRAGRP